MDYKIIVISILRKKKKSCRISPDPYFSLKKETEILEEENSETESKFSINGFKGQLDTI